MPYLLLGTVNVLPFLESGGIKWGLEDRIGESITTMDGMEHFDVLAQGKRTLSLTFPPLASEYINDILSMITPKVIEVETDIDPLFGHAIFSMNCQSKSTECTFIYDEGLVKWSGLAFDLKEF